MALTYRLGKCTFLPARVILSGECAVPTGISRSCRFFRRLAPTASVLPESCPVPIGLTGSFCRRFAVRFRPSAGVGPLVGSGNPRVSASSVTMYAGFIRSTVTIAFWPRTSMTNFLIPGFITLYGPSYGDCRIPDCVPRRINRGCLKSN